MSDRALSIDIGGEHDSIRQVEESLFLPDIVTSIMPVADIQIARILLRFGPEAGSF